MEASATTLRNAPFASVHLAVPCIELQRPLHRCSQSALMRPAIRTRWPDESPHRCETMQVPPHRRSTGCSTQKRAEPTCEGDRHGRGSVSATQIELDRERAESRRTRRRVRSSNTAGVIHPAQTLSRGNVALSMTIASQPRFRSAQAHAEPAGPPPTIKISQESMMSLVQPWSAAAANDTSPRESTARRCSPRGKT